MSELASDPYEQVRDAIEQLMELQCVARRMETQLRTLKRQLCPHKAARHAPFSTMDPDGEWGTWCYDCNSWIEERKE